MFVTANWMDILERTYRFAVAENRYRVGLVAPLVPVNGFGYVRLLDLLDLREKFLFDHPDHSLLSAADGIGVHSDGLVAEWLWRHMSPMDEVTAKLASRAPSYSVCPHRFSIGAIMLPRSVWQIMGKFPAEHKDGLIGSDEEHICKFCMDKSYAIVIAEGAFCAHFGFGPQTSHMLDVYRSNAELFA
jgi:hypothetical protein